MDNWFGEFTGITDWLNVGYRRVSGQSSGSALFTSTSRQRAHAFGHGKAESLAALLQAMFISGSACFLILKRLTVFPSSLDLQAPEYGIYVSLLAMVVTLALVLFPTSCGEENGQSGYCSRLVALPVWLVHEWRDYGRIRFELVWR